MRGLFAMRQAAAHYGLLFVGVCLLLAFVGIGLCRHALRRLPEVAIPLVALPVPNAFDSFIAAGRASSWRGIPADSALDDRAAPLGSGQVAYRGAYNAPAGEARLRANAPAMAMARRGLRQSYRNPAQRANDRLGYATALWRCGALLVTAAHARLGRHDWGGAARSGLDAVQMGEMLPNGAPLTITRIGCEIAQLGRNTLWQALPHLSRAQLLATQQRYRLIVAQRPGLAASLTAEKWMGQQLLLDMMRHNSWRTTIFIGEAPTDFWWQTRAMNYRSIAANSRSFFDGLIAASVRPLRGAQGAPVPPACTVADPVLCRVAALFLLAQPTWSLFAADDAMLRSALALQRYRLENGRYPAGLGALVPAYLPAVPLDPFGGGAPLRYRPRPIVYSRWHYRPVASQPGMLRGLPQQAAKSYALWSVGPDGSDQHGRPAQRSTPGDDHYAVNLVAQGDMVAGINRPAP